MRLNIRKSLPLTILWTGLLFFSVWNLITVYFDAKAFIARRYEMREMAIKSLMDANKGLDLSDAEILLMYAQKLDAAIEADLASFYLVYNQTSGQTSGKRLVLASKGLSEENKMVAYATSDEFLSLPDEETAVARSLQYAMGGDYYVMVGYPLYTTKTLFRLMATYKEDTIKHTVVLSLGLFVIAMWRLWGLMRALSFTKERMLNAANIKARSKEEEDLLRYMQTKEAEKAQFHEQLAQLTPQVAESIRKELSSGNTPPYEFMGTLVRLDINNLSTIRAGLNLEKRAKLDAIVDQFIHECFRLCSRYEGFGHEVIWDEMIGYFKDQGGENSCAFALGFLRSIFLEIPKFATMTKEVLSQDTEFTIKAAVDYGMFRVRVTSGDHALKINGDPFFSTVRMLPLVTEKTHSHALVTKVVAERTPGLARCDEYGSFPLRGLEQPLAVMHVKDWVPLKNQLHSPYDGVTFYRSIADFVQILEFVIDPRLSDQEFVAILKPFLTLQANIEDEKLVSTYENVLHYFLLLNQENRKLACLVALASGLFTLKILDLLKKDWITLLTLTGRASANAVDLFAHFGADMSGELGIDAKSSLFSSTEHNRKLANISYARAIQEITPGVVRDLSLMLGSGEAKFQASALWAIGRIAEHYRKINPLYLAGHEDFQKLSQRVSQFRSSLNSSVQDQAKFAESALRG